MYLVYAIDLKNRSIGVCRYLLYYLYLLYVCILYELYLCTYVFYNHKVYQLGWNLDSSIFLSRIRQLEQCAQLLLYSSIEKWKKYSPSSHRNKSNQVLMQYVLTYVQHKKSAHCYCTIYHMFTIYKICMSNTVF